MRADLLDATRRRGAFGRFKNVIHRHRIQDQWYEFRKEALRELAIEWQEENELLWK